MHMKSCEIGLKKGDKNGKKWYALDITHNYDSGKTYVEKVFLNEKEYNAIKGCVLNEK